MPFKGKKSKNQTKPSHKTHKGCRVSMCTGRECCTAQDSTAVGSNTVDLLVVSAWTSSEETQFILCNTVSVTFEGNLWRRVFVSKCSSSIQFDHVYPLPACGRAPAKTSSPLPQQREWAKCSSPLLHVLLSVLHHRGRLYAGSLPLQEPWHCIPEVQQRAVLPCCLGNANCWDTEYSSWTRGLIQGWEIIKRSALCYICLFLLQYFLNGRVVPKRYKLSLKQFLSVNVTFPPLITLPSDER